MSKTVAEGVRLSETGRFTTGVPTQFNGPRMRPAKGR